MSQAAFDAFLARLSQSLSLRAGRRADLADELRDHLEIRLEELLAEGHSRDEAIRLALDEFGDAAELAGAFSRLAKSRRRRFVMRCTAASSVVVAGVLLVALSLMPVAPTGPGAPQVVAQEEAAEPEAITSSNPGEESVEQRAIAALDRKLGQAVEVDFDQIPLREAVSKLTDQIKADVLFDTESIEEEGATVDDPVSLSLQHTDVTARSALDFLLEPQGLAMANRSGVLFVTSMTAAEELLTIKVYNARDLIEQAAPSYEDVIQPGGLGGGGFGGGGGLGGGTGGGGFFSVTDHIAAAAINGQLAQIGGGGLGGGAPSFRPDSPEHNATVALTGLIQQSTSGPWQQTDGSGGTIEAFNGLLVIRQSEQVHNEVRKLLDGLREANESGPGSSVTVPKGDVPGEEEEQTSGETMLRDLSVLEEYDITPNARTLLLGVEPGNAGEVGQLDALRSVTLTPFSYNDLPGGNAMLSWEYIRPLGIPDEQWRAAIDRSGATEALPGGMKKLLDRAKNHAGQGPINPKHLLLALLDYPDGPIPKVLAHVGLTAEGLQARIEGPAIEESGNQAPPEFESRKNNDDRHEKDNENGKKPSNTVVPDTTWLPTPPKLFDAARQFGVAIKVTKDESGHSFASGTIISANEKGTLILTAWHPFRGKGEDWGIHVTLPNDAGHASKQKFQAEFVVGNEEADLGLIRVDRQIHHPVAVIGAMADLPEPGDDVICVVDGVPNGDAVLPQKVTRINRFVGPSNIECLGPPVTSGSSGGGLLTHDLCLVGVCFAHVNEDQRNIYSGLATIHQFLKDNGHGDLIPASK